ncbi:hypothetical protein, partial [Bacillus paranthracis]|uniref:hypothetical protein n=1 Tax=Bacillus paranthracis TaxID=2026186 RepID=UPI00283E27E6
MAMMHIKEDHIKATYVVYKRAQVAKDSHVPTQDFTNQAKDIGMAMNASQDAQINGTRVAMMDMMQNIGAINAMSS